MPPEINSLDGHNEIFTIDWSETRTNEEVAYIATVMIGIITTNTTTTTLSTKEYLGRYIKMQNWRVIAFNKVCANRDPLCVSPDQKNVILGA